MRGHAVGADRKCSCLMRPRCEGIAHGQGKAGWSGRRGGVLRRRVGIRRRRRRGGRGRARCSGCRGAPPRRRERRGHFGRARESVFGLLRERMLDHRRDVRGRVGTQLAHRAKALGEMLHHHRGRVRRLERQLAGQHQIAHDTQRIDVAAAVRLALAKCLFGRHVRGRADRDAGDGQLRIALRRACDSEVGHHGAPALAVDQDVLGLDIAVDDTARVRVGERARDFAQQPA